MDVHVQSWAFTLNIPGLFLFVGISSVISFHVQLKSGLLSLVSNIYRRFLCCSHSCEVIRDK